MIGKYSRERAHVIMGIAMALDEAVPDYVPKCDEEKSYDFLVQKVEAIQFAVEAEIAGRLEYETSSVWGKIKLLAGEIYDAVVGAFVSSDDKADASVNDRIMGMCNAREALKELNLGSPLAGRLESIREIASGRISRHNGGGALKEFESGKSEGDISAIIIELAHARPSARNKRA